LKLFFLRLPTVDVPSRRSAQIGTETTLRCLQVLVLFLASSACGTYTQREQYERGYGKFAVRGGCFPETIILRTRKEDWLP